MKKVAMTVEWQGIGAYIIDGLIIIIFIAAIVLGGIRTGRFSFVNLSVQLASLLSAVIFGWIFTPMLVALVNDKLNFLSKISPHVSIWIAPHLEKIITTLFFLIISLLGYAFVKSFLFVFSRNYEWGGIRPIEGGLLMFIDRVGSVIFTMLTAYTYTFIIAALAAFPLLDLVREDTISGRILNGPPLLARVVDYWYQPYVIIDQALQLFNGELEGIVEDGEVDYERLLQFASENPNRIGELQGMMEKALPYLSDALAAQFKDFLNLGELTPDELETYICDNYLDEAVVCMGNIEEDTPELEEEPIVEEEFDAEEDPTEGDSITEDLELEEEANDVPLNEEPIDAEELVPEEEDESGLKEELSLPVIEV